MSKNKVVDEFLETDQIFNTEEPEDNELIIYKSPNEKLRDKKNSKLSLTEEITKVTDNPNEIMKAHNLESELVLRKYGLMASSSFAVFFAICALFLVIFGHPYFAATCFSISAANTGSTLAMSTGAKIQLSDFMKLIKK